VENGKVQVTFEESPVMSTYLVAFLVGEFSSVQDSFNVSENYFITLRITI
jgi:aminopeptidase N